MLSDSALERRVKRIERWLKRCSSACSHGSWGSALMEIECMEAETRGLRDDIWTAAEKEVALEESTKPRRASIVRLILVAAVLLLALELPLSVGQDRPYDPFEIGSVEMLTSTEAEILTELRRTLVSGNTGRIFVTVEPPQTADAASKSVASTRKTASAPAPVQKEKTRSASKIKTVEAKEQKTSEKNEISMEEVITLIQIGERAIRGHSVPIRGLQ